MYVRAGAWGRAHVCVCVCVYVCEKEKEKEKERERERECVCVRVFAKNIRRQRKKRTNKREATVSPPTTNTEETHTSLDVVAQRQVILN